VGRVFLIGCIEMCSNPASQQALLGPVPPSQAGQSRAGLTSPIKYGWAMPCSPTMRPWHRAMCIVHTITGPVRSSWTAMSGQWPGVPENHGNAIVQTSYGGNKSILPCPIGLPCQPMALHRGSSPLSAKINSAKPLNHGDSCLMWDKALPLMTPGIASPISCRCFPS